MVEKVRPALVVSVAYGDADRALITIVPHTTSLRGSQYEVPIEVTFLKAGAFLVQNVATYPKVRAVRRLGKLKVGEFNLVFTRLCAGLVTTSRRRRHATSKAARAVQFTR